MDGELPFGFTHRHKRSHAQMELEGSSSPTWSGVFDHLVAPREPTPSSSRANPADPHSPRPNNMPSQPRRFPGDGLDYRRPVSLNTVIDLTHDDEGAPGPPNDGQQRRPRPPRFGRDIMREGVIDLSEDEPRNQMPAPAPESPEIQIISARRIDPPRPAVDEDDVEFVRENPLPETQRRHHANANVNIMHQLLADMNNMRPTPHLEQQMQRRTERQRQATIARIQNRMHHRGPIPTVPRGRRVPQQAFLRPTFDYMAAAFNLGYDYDDPHDEPVPPPAPTYEAPAKAAQGYTRSPQEEDRLVCPNCGDELCNGETEQKRQVWIVKHCGHVYCGECTANRSIRKSTKGKERQAATRTKPFKECVVEGCQKRVSNKSHMFQVFL